jgi:hypothetical protein
MHSAVIQIIKFIKNNYKPKTPSFSAALYFAWVRIILKNSGRLPEPVLTVALTLA